MDSKNSILLIDPGFEPGTAETCALLVRVTADSFSYAIIDKTCNQLKAVYDQQESKDPVRDLAQKIKNDSYLGLPYQSVKVSVYTENTLAVPDEFFDVLALDNYGQYFSEVQSDHLYVQPFIDYGFSSVFNLAESAEETLGAWPESKRYDHSAPFLALGRSKEQDVLLLDFTVGSFHTTYLQDGKLIFQKYYQTDHVEEFNYYLLLIISQLQIDPAETSVHLSGIVHEDDEKYLCIAKYFKSVRFGTTTESDLDSRILDDMPAHYYSSLLALDQCV